MNCLVILLLSATAAQASYDAALQGFITANNLFAIAVYKELIKNSNENVLVSPYSAEAVLAFAQSGCKGNTARELRRSLYLPDHKQKIEAGIKASLPLLTGNDRYMLTTANKIYVKENFPINRGFKKSAVEVYGAEIEPIEFAKSVKAADTMNGWVEEKTNNKIRNLINPQLLDDYTRTILINALHFKANWSSQFKEILTRPQNFYKTERDVAQVETMIQYRKWYDYAESTELDAKILELPFLGGEASMVIILPNRKEGLVSLEQQIEAVFRPHNLKRDYLNVALPKFKIESTIQFVDILKNLGVRSAFDERTADLSGIAGEPGDLVISSILQKTYLDVVEGGVEAAAAAYVAVAVPISAEYPLNDPPPKNFIADHPFMFYIKIKDFIVFAGRVVAPRH